MSRALVDANVLLDAMTDDTQWHAWSADQLDPALPPDAFTRPRLPWEADFLAGKAFVR